MKQILIAYTTNAGSTAEVAQAVGKELGRDEARVEVKPMGTVKELKTYDAVVIGAPMIFGWHREARAFLKPLSATQLNNINLIFNLFKSYLDRIGELFYIYSQGVSTRFVG